jgi:hypothetical protein
MPRAYYMHLYNMLIWKSTKAFVRIHNSGSLCEAAFLTGGSESYTWLARMKSYHVIIMAKRFSAT